MASASTWCRKRRLIDTPAPRSRLALVAIFITTFALQSSPAAALSKSPIKLHFDWSTHVERGADCIAHNDGGCIGDNWPTTWTLDDRVLTSWGDGPGPRRRAGHSLGIASVSNPESSFALQPVYSGYVQGLGSVAYNGNCNGMTWVSGRVCGKTYAIINIVGTSWMWVSPGSSKTNYEFTRLYRSTDGARSWEPVKNKAYGEPGEPEFVEFRKTEKISIPAFAQFGRGYSDFSTNQFWVYIYTIRPHRTDKLQVQHNGRRGAIDLARVRPWNLDDRSKYEWFSGRGSTVEWTQDIKKRRAVFKDNQGVGWNLSVAWVKGIDRYILMTERKNSFRGNMGVYESTNPWGPWRIVSRYDNWACQTGAPDNVGKRAFYWNIPTRFINADDRSFWMFFSGIRADDSFNAVRAWFSDQEPSLNNCS